MLPSRPSIVLTQSVSMHEQGIGDALESRFALLEGDTSVDDDLLRLKTDLIADRSAASALPQAKQRAYETMPNFQAKTNNVDIIWP